MREFSPEFIDLYLYYFLDCAKTENASLMFVNNMTRLFIEWQFHCE